MENGINGDQNFYSRQHLVQSPDRQEPRTYPPPPPEFQQISPQLPPKLPFLTTQNLQTATANGFASATLNGGGVEPDRFYREYRGVHQNTHNYTEVTADSMPTATSNPRQLPSSLRSNGNGTTPRHPPLPLARGTPNQTYRSASSPLDGRAALGSAKSSPALNGLSTSSRVKELRKQFDADNKQIPSVPRKPAPRIQTKGLEGPGYMRERVGYQARTTPNSEAPAVRAGNSTRDIGGGRANSPQLTKTTKRTRYAVEDQQSNNILSGAARVSRPRNSVSGSSSQASKSMTNLAPTAAQSSHQPPSRAPLFGEVVSATEGGSRVAYGIPRTATRRTSDSSLPSSPTNWYRGDARLEDVNPAAHRSHNRNHSDFGDSKVNHINHIMPTFNTTAPTPTSPYHHASQSSIPSHNPPSRLPVASKRYSGSSESSSLPSTRGNSPSGSRRGSHGALRKPSQRPWSPASVSTLTTRSHTPTRTTGRGRARTPETLPINTSRLNAIITAPPPKLSPPLRSSRPRQPVSAASTASSRQKVADRSGSPHGPRMGMKVTRTGGIGQEKASKQSDRVIDAGPVDFAARRAKIQRAYTKSIHESEQKEIRAANLRRLKERQTREAITAQTPNDQESSPIEVAPTVPPLPVAPAGPLHINTALTSPPRHDAARPRIEDQDSPTLGIPGSFVDDDEPPPSAISNATGTTDIENEPQTEAPRLSRMVSSSQSFQLSSQVHFTEDQFSPEQAMFGFNHADNEESIHIMLDATPVEEAQTQSTPTNDLFSQGRELSHMSGLDQDYSENDQPVFSSIITIASPAAVTPTFTRTSTSLDSVSEQDVGPETSNAHYAYGFSSADGVGVVAELKNAEDFGEEQGQRFEESHLRNVPPVIALNEALDSLNTPITDIDYESSEGPGQFHKHEIYQIPSPNDDLRAPSPGFRSSHLSSWTDLSVESTASEDQLDPASPLVPTSEEGDLEKKPTPPPKETFLVLSPSVPPKPDGYSPIASPRYPLSPQHAGPSHSELPKLSTSGDFGLDFSNKSPDVVSVTPLWPEYAPPPPPSPTQQFASSELSPISSSEAEAYIAQPDATTHHARQHDAGLVDDSRRQSDATYSPRVSTSTPRSSIQISSEDITLGQSFESTSNDKASEDSKAAEKADKKRLFKRRMLITELIDTESVYLKDMNVVVEIYQGTAEACPKLDGTDITTIFRNTAQIVTFTTKFLDELKAGAASVYSPRHKTRPGRATTVTSSNTAPSPSGEERFSVAATLSEETDEQKDRKTFVGASFGKHLKKMQEIYTDYLKNSEQASSRLQTLQIDGAVKVWLSECNLVAKDLTAAWDLDALLVKPVQRITRYQLVLTQICHETPADHPDYSAISNAVQELSIMLRNIDDMKKRIHMVGQIVGRKRKESDVRSGIAKAFGRRAEKLQSNANRPPDDEVYVKLHEKFGDDYLRLQVVLRDVEFYTRQCSTYVNDFLRYLSAMELIMRMSASPYPELESKWARFNMSMRDMGTVALEEHVASVRQKVIEPFERVIQAYGPPGLVMKKRSKRRLDYEKFLATKASARDSKLNTMKDEYEALNETLKLELPKLSAKTETIGNICLIQFVNIQTNWYLTWQEKVRVVLEESQMPKDIEGIVESFSREHKYYEARIQALGIVNGAFDSGSKSRASQSTQDDDASTRTKGRPSNLSTRPRGLSVASDKSPSLPTPDFARGHNGNFTFSPLVATGPGLPHAYQTLSASHSRAGSSSPATPDAVSATRQHASSFARPSTSRSYTSDNGVPRLSNDYNPNYRRDSYNSASQYPESLPSARPYSGLFNSALPDGPEEVQRSSRTSSHDRTAGNRFNVLYLAASLFEFNIGATKSEAGYPYLTYGAGEIFDVIGEKGELWLAKNQDDPREVVGWIWSKHFARLAAD